MSPCRAAELMVIKSAVRRHAAGEKTSSVGTGETGSIAPRPSSSTLHRPPARRRILLHWSGEPGFQSFRRSNIQNECSSSWELYRHLN